MILGLAVRPRSLLHPIFSGGAASFSPQSGRLAPAKAHTGAPSNPLLVGRDYSFTSQTTRLCFPMSLGAQAVWCPYRLIFRRTSPARPRMPDPNSTSVPGSGVGVGPRLNSRPWA